MHRFQQICVGRLPHVEQNGLEDFVHVLREEAALFIEDFAAKQSTNVALDPRGFSFTIHFFPSRTVFQRLSV